ncbi:unnamed protein product [Sphagnum balticum]
MVLGIGVRTMESTSLLKRWSSDHPAIQNFQWNRETTWASSPTFVLAAVVGYIAVSQALSALLARRKNPVPLGYIPTLHNLFLALGSAAMFMGCLQATIAEVERSPRHSADWVLCFPQGIRAAGPVFFWSINRPPSWKKVVTNLQIVQFVFSFVASVATLWLHFKGDGCSGMYAWLFNAFFNVTLLLLFLNFHSKQYGSKKSSSHGSRNDKQA